MSDVYVNLTKLMKTINKSVEIFILENHTKERDVVSFLNKLKLITTKNIGIIEYMSENYYNNNSKKIFTGVSTNARMIINENKKEFIENSELTEENENSELTEENENSELTEENKNESSLNISNRQIKKNLVKEIRVRKTLEKNEKDPDSHITYFNMLGHMRWDTLNNSLDLIRNKSEYAHLRFCFNQYYLLYRLYRTCYGIKYQWILSENGFIYIIVDNYLRPLMLLENQRRWRAGIYDSKLSKWCAGSYDKNTGVWVSYVEN
jgi:hypothetical protein